MNQGRVDRASGSDTAWWITELVWSAMQSLTADQQETIWSVAYTETLDQAAEIDGLGDDLWAMAYRREAAFHAFVAAFDSSVAELVGIIREPKPKPVGRKHSEWWHDAKRCAICSAPVVVRYIGGQRCEQCGRAMPKPRAPEARKRYCSARCKQAAWRAAVTNRRSAVRV